MVDWHSVQIETIEVMPVRVTRCHFVYQRPHQRERRSHAKEWRVEVRIESRMRRQRMNVYHWVGTYDV